jgi:hypothetical protein
MGKKHCMFNFFYQEIHVTPGTGGSIPKDYQGIELKSIKEENSDDEKVLCCKYQTELKNDCLYANRRNRIQFENPNSLSSFILFFCPPMSISTLCSAILF